jgi:hypothetical protein
MGEEGKLACISSIEEMDQEIERIISDSRNRLVGLVAMDNIVGIRRETNSLLMEAIKKHDRHLRHLLGEPIEPVAHTAEAVLVGVFGDG